MLVCYLSEFNIGFGYSGDELFQVKFSACIKNYPVRSPHKTRFEILY